MPVWMLVDITSNTFYKRTANFETQICRTFFSNKIKWVHACMDARGHHLQHLLQVHSDFPNAMYN
jgi:hypothetical protein